MSTLTKVFALLVSALSIFLCGIVITFITNTQDWKKAYDDQKTKAQALQVHSLASEMQLTDANNNNSLVIQKLKDNIVNIQQSYASLSRQLETEKIASANEKSRANTAIKTMEALRKIIEDMYASQMELQKTLDDDRSKMIAAQTQAIELTRQLNSLQADNDQLKSKIKQQIEQVYELEEENASLRQASEKVALSSSKFQGDESVTEIAPAKSGVPIRGQITEVDGENAAITVGTSSGVRKGMKFMVTRGGKFLGNLVVIHVEANEAVGSFENQQGAIVRGDSVTTGFN